MDSLDKARIDVVDMLEKIFKESIECELTGGIVLSSTDSLGCYLQVDVITKKVVEYHLFGFSLEDTTLFLKKTTLTLVLKI